MKKMYKRIYVAIRNVNVYVIVIPQLKLRGEKI